MHIFFLVNAYFYIQMFTCSFCSDIIFPLQTSPFVIQSNLLLEFKDTEITMTVPQRRSQPGKQSRICVLQFIRGLDVASLAV
jgi:membrane protein YqaA with SNARE-associated domain